MSTAANEAPIQDLEFGYDTAGNVDWKRDYLATDYDLPFLEEQYQYDALNRLVMTASSAGHKIKLTRNVFGEVVQTQKLVLLK